MAEMVVGELATARQFKRPMLTAGVVSSGAPARGSTPEAVVGAGDPPQVVAQCGVGVKVAGRW
jgi:hypothetical protein